MRVIHLAICLASMVLAGCISRKDVSNVDPFSDYVGRSVPLKRQAVVVHRYNSLWGGDDGVGSLSSADVGVINTPDYPYIEKIDNLPVGHLVKIDRVIDEVVIDGEHIVAYGRTTLPRNGKEVRFAYPWGTLWILERAPWEPQKTPLSRGPVGKLPPHFDYDIFQRDPNLPKWGTKISK